MNNELFGGCPYQAEDGFNDRNRFPKGHLFIGEIENGKRYPFGVYTKEEADERFAMKGTETDVAELQEAVATKASQDAFNDLVDVVNSKASEAEAEAIRARLDALEYTEIDISSFTAEPTVCEFGSSNTIQLTWALSKQATEQNINGTPVSGNSVQYTGVTDDTTYTLNVSDGNTFDTASVSVEFANQIYFGAAADLSDVAALESTLSNDPQRTITVNAGADEYIIYAIPARLGDVTFFVSGFEGGFESPVEQMLTNSSGYHETYRVYRSTRAGLGSTTVEVREV